VHYHRFAHRRLLAEKLGQLFDGICDDDYFTQRRIAAEHKLPRRRRCYRKRHRAAGMTIKLTGQLVATAPSAMRRMAAITGKKTPSSTAFWGSGSWHHKTS
jgi:hypothetical protein